MRKDLLKNHSALAFSMYESAQANFLFTWILYFEGNDVYVQNNIIFLNEHEGFTPEKINKSIKPRAIYNEDGMAISEWHTDMNSVMSFFNSLKN
ncbi:hypothetical protein [Escherichia albertii]|uniref:hypothetical protein n=1 Tax=Escherichia albertii TaxID=208962 RepID=UPI0030816307